MSSRALAGACVTDDRLWRGLAPGGIVVGEQMALLREQTRLAWTVRGDGSAIAAEGALSGKERCSGGQLGNTANRVSPPLSPAERLKPLTKLQRKKLERQYGMRDAARGLSHHGTMSGCGLRRANNGDVGMSRGADGRVFFSGLERCGSVWECPCCAPAIAGGRGRELKELLSRHRSFGGSAYLVTLTIPHDVGDDLRPMRRHVSRGWQFVQGGAPWKRIKKAMAIFGTVRALEVTHGVNGWQPHLHEILCTNRALTSVELEELRAWLLKRWRFAIAKPVKENGKQYREPSEEHGVVITASHEDQYITKMGLAGELALGHEKEACDGRRTPFEILFDYWSKPKNFEHEERAIRDAALWIEYADEMHGARQLTWSKGLRERYELEEQTDLELAAEEERQPAVQLCLFEKTTWDAVVSRNLKLQMDLLEAGRTEWPPGEFDSEVLRLLDKARGLEIIPF